MAFSAGDIGDAGVRRVGRNRVLGHHQPAGLARLRTVAGGYLIARLHAGSVFEPRGPALRVRPDDRRSAPPRVIAGCEAAVPAGALRNYTQPVVMNRRPLRAGGRIRAPRRWPARVPPHRGGSRFPWTTGAVRTPPEG